MAKTKVSATRAPRGSRVVTKAFFTALDDVREAQQESVARAAQIMIRDELKARRANAGSAATKRRGRWAYFDSSREAGRERKAPGKIRSAEASAQHATPFGR